MILLCAVSSYSAEEKSKNTKAIVNENESNESRRTTTEEPPEGYYAFVESPNAEPPRVRPPPYIDSDKECYGRSGISKANSKTETNYYEIPLYQLRYIRFFYHGHATYVLRTCTCIYIYIYTWKVAPLKVLVFILG